VAHRDKLSGTRSLDHHLDARMPDLGSHVHVYTPPTDYDGRTLLVLHGTGGDEHDLVPLGQMLAPTAGLLSPRGNVSENGAARFFRRLAEGVFDIEDLHARTKELAVFVKDAATHYKFDAGKVIAVGFSNGANIAGSLLLSNPGLLRAAILFRAMVPFEPATRIDLSGTDVFIGAGRADPLVAPAQSEALAGMLGAAGANVTLDWQPVGHTLSKADVDAAHSWLESLRIT
jgi:phospholipase/carboxylesterase/glyoxalase family protein